MNKYTGKTVMVTGAAKGIGLAIARYFAEFGAQVIIVDLDKKLAQSAAAKLCEKGYDVTAICADVSQPVAVEKLVATVKKQFKKIDVLVNNAGIVLRAPVTEIEPDQWDRVMNVNVKSIYLLAKEIIPSMINAGGGSIVNIASGWGLVAGASAAAYCASKGAVVLLTKSMSIDYGKMGIRVNCVCPGDTDTDMLQEEARQLSIDGQEMLEAGTERPLGRVGNPSEIATTVGFLASNDSSYVTGTALVVDGGSLAGSS